MSSVKRKKVLQCTDAHAWAMVLADFAALATGIDPSTGEPWYQDDKGIWQLILLFSKADMEGIGAWGVPSYANADLCCGSCGANSDDRPYSDLRELAGW